MSLTELRGHVTERAGRHHPLVPVKPWRQVMQLRKGIRLIATVACGAAVMGSVACGADGLGNEQGSLVDDQQGAQQSGALSLQLESSGVIKSTTSGGGAGVIVEDGSGAELDFRNPSLVRPTVGGTYAFLKIIQSTPNGSKVINILKSKLP